MPHDRRPYIILPIAALIAISPLLFNGCSCGHDFDFHIINWFEAAKQFTHGTVHPHWAFTPAWNAGEPRFVFYPPLSWTIGALLGLIMPWAWTPIVYTWLALAAAGLALNYAARSFTTPNAALIAAAIYIANPYTLYTVYERSAYAELLAAAWIPLLLHAILREHVTIPRIAIPIALLWLTNAPAAVMGCYALALLAIIRLAATLGAPSSSRSLRLRLASRQNATTPARLVLNTIFGTALGLGLAAVYILPAAYERRFVQIAFAILPGLSPQENFLFHHTSDPEHDAVLHTASIVAVVLILLTIAALIIAITLRAPHPSQNEGWESDKPGAPSSSRSLRLRWASRQSAIAPAHLTLSLVILAATIAFLLTPLSAPLWQHLPELEFLQFPWRLIAILATVFAMALAIALSGLRLSPARTSAAALLATAALTIPAYLAFHQRCYPEDTLSERLSIFRSANPGTDPTDEYTPNTADNDALANANPGYWLSPVAEASASKDSVPGPAPLEFDLASAAAQTLILNLRDYPAWRITLNGSPVTTRLHRDDGLIAIPVSAGPSRIEITYTTLADQNLGYLISTLSLLCLTALLVHNKAHTEPEHEAPQPSR